MSTEITEILRTLKLKYAMEAYRQLSKDESLLATITLDDAFQAVLTAEIDGRAAARRKMLLKMAKIPVPAEMRDVSYDENRGQAFAKKMARVRTMSLFETGSNLCILGSSGSGKTFLSAAIAREAVNHGYDTLFVNARDEACLLAEKRRQGALQYRHARGQLLRKKVLVLDDFCLTAPDEAEVRSLFDILEDRSGKCSTIVTSQKDHNRWLEEIGTGNAIGEAVVERIMANSLTIELGTGSRRRRLDDECDGD